MLMEDRPNASLPLYDVLARCNECNRREIHRVEVLHPVRGLILCCGICAGLIRAGFR